MGLACVYSPIYDYGTSHIYPSLCTFFFDSMFPLMFDVVTDIVFLGPDACACFGSFRVFCSRAFGAYENDCVQWRVICDCCFVLVV